MNTCPYDPTEMAGKPIGMFHCPICLEMVLAGLPHPDYSILDNDDEIRAGLEDYYGESEGPYNDPEE